MLMAKAEGILSGSRRAGPQGYLEASRKAHPGSADMESGSTGPLHKLSSLPPLGVWTASVTVRVVESSSSQICYSSSDIPVELYKYNRFPSSVCGPSQQRF